MAKLEALSRERAVDELRRAWDALTDEELALLCKEVWDRGSDEPSPQGLRAEEKLQASMPEATIASAIGHAEGMPQDEVERRLTELVGRFGIPERRAGVQRRLRAMSGEGR